ncbi:MAG TPA: carboxypeptidase-like regulatory domain-containing protein, partial [Agriterribacter sp.]|nr:carboxypeptidase-like regulatory domain-containing protein [Agriterribacter sp.]
MKVSFIITTLLSLHISILANAQKEISLSVKKEPLRNVLTLIEKHSGYRFLYTDDPVFENSRITLKVQKAAFEEVMNRILAGTGLGYTVNNNELVVLSFTPSAPLAIITGRVTDEEGNPLPGVTVQVKGANTSAVTNTNGEFSIDAGDNAILVFSSVGFITQE